MEEFGVSPFRTPESLARTHAIRIQAIRRSARGSRLCGVDVKVLVFAFAHITIPALLLMCNTQLNVYLHAAGRLESFWAVAYVALAVDLMISAVVLYALVYASDPGWVELERGNAGHHGSLPLLRGEEGEAYGEGGGGGSGGPAGAQQQLVLPPPCQYCGARPPLRSRHCLQTGQCVVKFDHYCHLLSTAVGDLNHLRYFLYILCELKLSAWALFEVLQRVAGLCLGGPCWDTSDAELAVLLALVVVLVALVGLFGYLVALHTYLMSTGQTTYEVVKGSKVPYLTPYFTSPSREGQGHQQQHTCGSRAQGRFRLPQEFPQLLLAHLVKGQGPPAPFSRGLAGNLRDFWRFWPRSPLPYRPTRPPPSAVNDHLGQNTEGLEGSGGVVPSAHHQLQAIDVQFSQGEV